MKLHIDRWLSEKEVDGRKMAQESIECSKQYEQKPSMKNWYVERQ